MPQPFGYANYQQRQPLDRPGASTGLAMTGDPDADGDAMGDTDADGDGALARVVLALLQRRQRQQGGGGGAAPSGPGGMPPRGMAGGMPGMDPRA